MDFVEACRKLISIDSTPAHGNMEVAKWLAEVCRARGFQVELQNEVVGGIEQANVLVRFGSAPTETELLLQTHLDTSDPGPFQLWAKTGFNPFDATIIDGHLYGLGAADVKLDFLCKLEAMASFDMNTKWKVKPLLVGTFGEESGMQGALKFIRKNKVSAKMALIGEASHLNIVSAAKGFASVDIRVPFSQEEVAYRHEHNLRESTTTQSKLFTGKAAHSSEPHLGESAISKMLEYLLLLPEAVSIMEIDGGTNANTVPGHALLELDVVSSIKSPITKKLIAIYLAIKELDADMQKISDKDFNPGHPTLSIGVIRTHEDHVMLSGNCRLPPVVTQEIYESWMDRLREVCEGQGALFRINEYKKPFRTAADSKLIRVCQEELGQLGFATALISQPSTNEASIFSRVGIECVSFGPGQREGNAHTPEENVAVENLHRAIEFYKRIIERFCL